MLPQYEIRLRKPNILGPHNFIRGAFFEHAILMDSRFMRKSVSTHDGFVPLHHHPRNVGNQVDSSVPRRGVLILVSALDNSHCGFVSAMTTSSKRAVARPFAQGR